MNHWRLLAVSLVVSTGVCSACSHRPSAPPTYEFGVERPAGQSIYGPHSPDLYCLDSGVADPSVMSAEYSVTVHNPAQARRIAACIMRLPGYTVTPIVRTDTGVPHGGYVGHGS